MKKIIIILMLVVSSLSFSYTQEDLIEYSNLIEKFKFHYIYVEEDNENAERLLNIITNNEGTLLFLRRNFDIYKDDKDISNLIGQLKRLAELYKID